MHDDALAQMKCPSYIYICNDDDTRAQMKCRCYVYNLHQLSLPLSPN